MLWTLGHFLKPLATIKLPKSPAFLGNFSKGVKIYHFSSEIIFGQLFGHTDCYTFANFVFLNSGSTVKESLEWADGVFPISNILK